MTSIDPIMETFHAENSQNERSNSRSGSTRPTLIPVLKVATSNIRPRSAPRQLVWKALKGVNVGAKDLDKSSRGIHSDSENQNSRDCCRLESASEIQPVLKNDGEPAEPSLLKQVKMENIKEKDESP